jgi:hypothetical protein
MNIQEVKRLLPEYKEILEMAGGYKPRKFVEKIRIIECPTMYNPSGLGDYAYRTSYYVDKNGVVTHITGYSYDTMMYTGVQPVERMIDIPEGTRVWIVTYDGIWGGHWDVNVFVHKNDYKLLESGNTDVIIKREHEELEKKLELYGERVLKERANIPIQETTVLIPGSGCGQTKHQKYGAYLNALKEHPDIIPYLLKNIDENPNREIIVKALDIAKELGPYFEKLGETAIGWGLKFSLFTEGIFVSTTKSKEINPATGEGYMLLRMRRPKADDVLSEGLRKYLEPSGEPDSDKPVDQC